MTNEVDEAVRVRCHARSPASAHLCIAPQQLALATGQDAGVTRSGLGCQRRQQWVRGGRARVGAKQRARDFGVPPAAQCNGPAVSNAGEG